MSARLQNADARGTWERGKYTMAIRGDMGTGERLNGVLQASPVNMLSVGEPPSLEDALAAGERASEIHRLYRQLRWWMDALATQHLSDEMCKRERERIIKRLDELEKVNG